MNRLMVIVKKYAVWLVLVLTVIASYSVSTQDEPADDELEVTAQPRKTTLDKQDAQIDANKLSPLNAGSEAFGRPQIVDEPENIFTMFVSKTDLDQQSVEQEIEPPPENPFKFAGKLIDNGEVVVFLMDGAKNYSVRAGDVLEGNWEVKAITPPMMTIKYIPLNIEMQMQIGAVI